MKKSLVLICAAAVLCAGFGKRAEQQETAVPQGVPAAAEDAERIRITLPSDEELERDLMAVGEALRRLADAFQIERVPAEENFAQQSA